MASKNKPVITAEPGKHDLYVTREFDAPCDLVFLAHTDADLYSQWLGPRGVTMKLETFEPKLGGRYRYLHYEADGSEYGFHGVYHEVSPQQIIQTFEYEGMPGHVSLETLTFEPLPDRRTRIVSHSVFLTVEDRDGMIQSGMEIGIREGYERLDEVLETLPK